MRVRAFVLIAGVALIGAGTLAATATPQAPRTAQMKIETAVADDFRKRVDEYVKLHKQIEGKLPKLPKEATPQQIDQEQRALGQLVAEARPDAKPGDLFTPAMQKFIRTRFVAIFKGTPGQQMKKYIHDEPHPVTPEINKRYPDIVPLSTMPLTVLAVLPKLPEELEYRFVANHLILMDVHAHVILDYVLNAIPVTTPPATK